MDEVLSSSLIGWLLLAVLAVEAAGLGLLWRSRHIGLPPGQIVSFLGAGGFFAMALIAALSAWPVVVLGVSLVGAFLCHAADLWLRWHG